MGSGAVVCLLWRAGRDKGSSLLCMYIYLHTLVTSCRQSVWFRPGPGLEKYAAKYALGFLRPSYFYPIASGPADLHLLHITGAQ
uniref:Uncharacterized protein n=1 Tax=Brassica oleracea TaxID=3712 RepID=A0A3P6EZ37_BRAOL|nr:unnamed protein product [Brassica oleracea]